jgi:hypothetical protein
MAAVAAQASDGDKYTRSADCVKRRLVVRAALAPPWVQQAAPQHVTRTVDAWCAEWYIVINTSGIVA